MFWILTCFEKTMFALQEGFTFNFTALIIQKAFTVTACRFKGLCH